VESVGFTLLGLLPNVLQGLFWRRERVVGVVSRLGIDRLAVGLVGRLRQRHGPRPLWVRAGSDQALLLLSIDDVRRVLEGSPDPFAPDPDAKRRGMSHFQPHALTISRGERWENRRRFTEAVLDTGKPLHRLADRFLAAAREESAELLQDVETAGGRLEFKPFHRALRRITRRIVLGDRARDDEDVSDLLATLMAEANKLPDEHSEHFEPFMAKLNGYVAAAEPGSLVGLFDEAPSDPRTEPAGQLPHWMFAMSDTLAMNAFRALALIASHQRQGERVQRELDEAGGDGPPEARARAGLTYLEACLEEAMRLWPTTPLLTRETLTEVSWDGATVPSGTQILISNTFNHRDRARHEFADRFEPAAWTEGAGEDWSFNHFSHGPQGCPGAGLALFVGKAVLAELLTRGRVRLLEPELRPDGPLPHSLDAFRLRFALEPKP
jgi:cytochrome P450